MQKTLKPISEACPRLGLKVQAIKRLIDTDPTFPAHQLGNDRSHWRYDPDELEVWIKAQRQRRHDAFRDRVRGRAETFLFDEDIEIDAASDLRSIMLTGRAPESFAWTSAHRFGGSPPSDICVGLGVAASAPWGIAIEKVERLMSLPGPKKAQALKLICERLATYHASRVVL